MKGSSGILLVAVGLVALYIVLSGKYQCMTDFASCMTGADFKTPEGYTKGTPQIQTPQQPSFRSYFPGIFDSNGNLRLP